MIAARMFGRITFQSRCHQVAPSTWAASIMSSDTCARPARSRSDMNGVVFQISETQMAMKAGTVWPNQLKSASTNGSHALTKPFWKLNANCHAKPETTVMIP